MGGRGAASGANDRSISLHDNVAKTQKKNRIPSDEYNRMVALRNEIQQYAISASFNQREIYNPSFGHQIKITNKGVNKATSGTRHLEELEALRYLPRMLKRAIYKGPEKDKKKHSGIVQFHLFEAQRKIFGKKYTFVLKIREYPNGNFFYDSYTKKISRSN